jgi:hypothetical protein
VLVQVAELALQIDSPIAVLSCWSDLAPNLIHPQPQVEAFRVREPRIRCLNRNPRLPQVPTLERLAS